MKKIKVCLVIPGHWTDVMGGAQYQAECLMNALIKDGGYEIFYVTRNYDQTFRPIGYQIVGIDKPFRKIKRGYLYLDAIKLLRKLKAISPDVIYQRIGCAYTGIAAYYARHNNCRMVWHVSSDSDVSAYKPGVLSRGLGKYLDRKILEYGIRNADHIITQTSKQAMLLKNNFSGKTASAVIRNFHPLPNEPYEKHLPYKVAWVANLKRLKQPEIFIKLAQELQGAENIEFIMVGDVQVNSKTKVLLNEQIKKTKNLRYLGCRSQSEVNNILSESHLLVNTSLWEGFPNTFIQAWMRRVPVVSLYVDPDNILQEKKVGICSGSYDKLKVDMINLIRNPGLMEEMGMQAQAYAFEHHSEKNANDILSILKTS